jgi:ABC-type sugar transport system permease subunit
MKIDDIPKYIVKIFFFVCLILGLSIFFSVLKSIIIAPLSTYHNIIEHLGQIRSSLKNTAVLFLVSFFFQSSIVFFGTLAVHKIPAPIKILISIPYVAGVVAPAFSFYVFFSSALGPLHIGLLGTETGTRFIIAVLDTWQWAGILLLACIFKLEQIPESHFEQAHLEGISRLRTWALIIWPKIRGVIGIFFIVRALDWFRKLDTVKLILLDGGPGYVGDSIGMYISRNYYFSKEPSYAALLLLVQMILLAWALARVFRWKLTGWLDDEE